MMRDGAWMIVDAARNAVPIVAFNRKGARITCLDSRTDAWAHLDKLRDAAGCGMPPRVPITVLSTA
jgi:hypothetical protein